MKEQIARTAFAAVFAAGLIVSLVAPAHAWDGDHSCTMAHAAGKYAFSDNGTVIGIGPRVAAGAFTLDAAGNLTNGVATSSLNGTVAFETFSGTYTVNPDCTGSLSVNIYAGGTELFTVTGNLAYDDDMKQFRGIFTSIVTPGGNALSSVIGIEARKQ